MMAKNILPTRPPAPGEKLLRDKFYESVAAQDELMSKLAGQLLTLELAIPGLYATALKLVRGGQAVLLPLTVWFYLTYACWLAALGVTLYALFPKNWRVDPEIMRQNPEKFAEALGIEDFFRKTAEHKRWLLIVSSGFFFAGIFAAGFVI